MQSPVNIAVSGRIHGPILGIESSCDETAAAVLDADGHVLAEAVLSQQLQHAPFGGVVPEIAARAHLAHLPGLVRDVLTRASVGVSDLGGVAASAGPGLIGGLIVGSQFAKGIAIARGLPYVAVNHLEAHALTARLPGLVAGGPDGVPRCGSHGGLEANNVDGGSRPAGAQGPGAPDADRGGEPDPAGVEFPYLLLLVSGGHCQCVAVEGVGRYRRLGATVDDAAGEAFDKVGKLLGLGWPGGPALERLAAGGDPRRYAFPRPMLGRAGCDFSFSGLKTAVAQTVARLPPGALPTQLAADIAAGFQAAVTDVLADRVSHAMTLMRDRASLLVVAGGVAANQAVRAALQHAAAAHDFRLVAPPIRLCTDNAVMVAWAGLERLRLGLVDGIEFAPRPRWPLEALAPSGTR